jgi:hypothetical protein
LPQFVSARLTAATKNGPPADLPGVVTYEPNAEGQLRLKTSLISASIPAMESDSWWRKPCPQCVLLFGLVVLVLAVISTFTGKTYLKVVTDRAKDPFNYWLNLVTQYVFAAFLIWLFYTMPR